MAEVNQTDNHRAGFIIEVACFHRKPLRPQIDAHRVEPGDAGTQRHQRIHCRGAVLQAFPRAAVEMATGKHHHRQRDNTDSQPQGAVIIADHHVVADHPPAHDRDTDQQGDDRLPAEALHGGDSGFLLTLAAFEVVFDGFRAVARFLYGLD